MNEEKCSKCGKITKSKSEWLNCKECDTSYCPDCAEEILKGSILSEKQKTQKEVQRLKKISKGKDLSMKKRALCPNCESMLDFL